MLTITYDVSGQKKKKLLLFAGHIHDKRNFCLLAEEFPFILLANLSAAEATFYFQDLSVLSRVKQASCYGYS